LDVIFSNVFVEKPTARASISVMKPKRKAKKLSRLEKWDKNFNVENVSQSQMLWKQRMLEQLAITFEIQEKLENIVKKIMGESGLPTWHNIPYHNFARKLYKLCTRCSGKTLKQETALLVSLSQQNQLKFRLLIKIRNAIQDLVQPVK